MAACVAAYQANAAPTGWMDLEEHGRRMEDARLIARDLFTGEGLKLGITAILFALVCTNFNQLEIFAVLVGFVATVLVGQLSIPFLLGGTRKY